MLRAEILSCGLSDFSRYVNIWVGEPVCPSRRVGNAQGIAQSGLGISPNKYDANPSWDRISRLAAPLPTQRPWQHGFGPFMGITASTLPSPPPWAGDYTGGGDPSRRATRIGSERPPGFGDAPPWAGDCTGADGCVPLRSGWARPKPPFGNRPTLRTRV